MPTIMYNRHETFASMEMQDFMNSIPENLLTTSSSKNMHSVKVTTHGTGGISPRPTQLAL